MTGYFRTALLLAAMTALFLGIGYAMGGAQGAVIAFFLALATNAWAWWNSDRMVLSMHNAEPVTPEQAPRLYQMVEALAARAGMPMPALYIIHEEQPNAFATGRNPENAAVAVNTGLLNLLSEEEAAGVIAHELAHIRHRDTLIMTVTATLAGAIGMLAQFGYLMGGRGQNGQRSGGLGPIGMLLMMVLGPLAAMLVQMAISRSREYEADRGGAEICGDPRWLASALMRLEQGAAATVNQGAEANPATAHLFIVNPLHGGALAGLFRTHPPIEERVSRLMALAGGGGWGGGSGWNTGGHAGGWGGTPQPPPAQAYPPQSPWGAGGPRNPWG